MAVRRLRKYSIWKSILRINFTVVTSKVACVADPIPKGSLRRRPNSSPFGIGSATQATSKAVDI